MAPADAPVTAIGAAAESYPLPSAPTADGVVCPCMGTTVADLEEAFDRGYNELELLKRASWAGLGTCQGGVCLPHVRAFIAERTGGVPDPFTARPGRPPDHPRRGRRRGPFDAFRRTPLHDEHLAARRADGPVRRLVAAMALRRPVGEYWAVREGVSIGDVSTLGKLIVSGPDVVEAARTDLSVPRRGHQGRAGRDTRCCSTSAAM